MFLLGVSRWGIPLGWARIQCRPHTSDASKNTRRLGYLLQRRLGEAGGETIGLIAGLIFDDLEIRRYGAAMVKESPPGPLSIRVEFSEYREEVETELGLSEPKISPSLNLNGVFAEKSPCLLDICLRIMRCAILVITSPVRRLGLEAPKTVGLRSFQTSAMSSREKMTPFATPKELRRTRSAWGGESSRNRGGKEYTDED